METSLLLIEDNPSDAARVLRALDRGRTERYPVEHVPSLSEALPLLETGRFRLVLVDYTLPDSPGHSAIRKIQEAAPDVPLIVLTRPNDDSSGLLSVRKGVVDYIVKGVTDDASLRRTVRHALERDRVQRDFGRVLVQCADGIMVVDRKRAIRFSNPAGEGMFPVREPFPHQLQDGLRREISIPEKGVAEMHVTEIEWEGEPSFLVALRDMTERKNLEEQLRHAQKMESVGRLAGGVAHEFNNLLMVMTGHAQWLLSRKPAEDPDRSSLEEIVRAATRGSDLTRQLLTFSRAQRTRAEAVEIDRVIASFHEMIDRALGKEITLTARLGAAGKMVLADRAEIEQVLMNLVVNARDSMPAGGELRLETECVERPERLADLSPGSYLHLSVHDYGEGIAPEHLSKIFEPFFTTKPAGRGTGLGLSTTHAIIRECGGHIEADSHPAQGTTFHVYLPLLADAPPSPKRILVVEEDDSMRRILVDTLRNRGFQVLEAADAARALELAGQGGEACDLLVTDALPRGMTGTSLAELLREECPGLKALFLSDAPEASPGETLQKPVALPLLVRRVEDLVLPPPA